MAEREAADDDLAESLRAAIAVMAHEVRGPVLGARAAIERVLLGATTEGGLSRPFESGSLEQLTAAWRELEHMRAEFMRSAAHELRAPLSLVVGFGELLHGQTVEHPADPETAELAEQIHANALLLMRLVDDLLDFSKIERGEITIQLEDFELAESRDPIHTGIGARIRGEQDA